MTPKLIKHLDYWIGTPILFLLTFWKYIVSLLSFKEKKNKNINPNKIVFIKLIEQGATVLAYPAIKKAVDMVDAENVYFMVFSENKPILEAIYIIPEKNIFTIRNKGMFFFIFDVFKIIIKLNKVKIDTAIDMEFFSRSSAILTYLSGAKNRVGYHRYSSEFSYRGNLMTHKIQYNPYIHVSVAYMLLVDCLNSDNKSRPLPKINLDNVLINAKRYFAKENEKEEVKSCIEIELREEILNPIFIINPNTSDLIPIRKWDEDNFINLSKRLINHFEGKLTIVITGSLKEAASSLSICKKINSNRVVSLAGKTSMKELLALYEISDILITNDSGPGHFASMTKINNIVLFGPETATLYGPIGENVFCIRANLSCSPCVNPFNHRFSPCKENLCMKSISVDMVFDKIIEIFHQK